MGNSTSIQNENENEKEKDDYIEEQSLTEAGAMEDPEFVFKFKGIEKR